jgi:Cu-processing system permease protein
VTRVGLVAWHVFKESVRDRVLFAIAAFALLLVAASILIGQITAGQDVKIIKDIGLATLELAGVLMAVFIGVGLVSREIERKSVYSLLAKPVHRWEFVAGKYLGLVGTIAVNVLLMTVALFVVLAVLERKAPDPVLLKAVVLILAELALLTAVALFFSTFSSSGILSAGLTLGVWVVGIFSEDLRGFSAVVSSQVLAATVRAVGMMVPAFSAFDIKAEVVSGRPSVPWTYVAMTLAYAACYAGALVGASMAIFSRREFK